MAKLTTWHKNALVARAMEISLRADNEDAPHPLRIRSRVRGRQLTSEIRGAEDVESLLLTLDDLLLCMVAAEKTLSSVELNSPRHQGKA